MSHTWPILIITGDGLNSHVKSFESVHDCWADLTCQKGRFHISMGYISHVDLGEEPMDNVWKGEALKNWKGWLEECSVCHVQSWLIRLTKHNVPLVRNQKPKQTKSDCFPHSQTATIIKLTYNTSGKHWPLAQTDLGCPLVAWKRNSIKQKMD